jgi:hypothetical protein
MGSPFYDDPVQANVTARRRFGQAEGIILISIRTATPAAAMLGCLRKRTAVFIRFASTRKFERVNLFPTKGCTCLQSSHSARIAQEGCQWITYLA